MLLSPGAVGWMEGRVRQHQDGPRDTAERGPRTAAGRTRPQANASLPLQGGALVSPRGMALSPAVVTALQRGIGNAAVVQMLREAGHPGAGERHRHSADCGHPQPEHVPVQRSSVHDVLRSTGRPLDEGTRTEMESRMDADFADVRVHTDAAARASAAEVGARAYTSGNHVVIGEGGADRHTLAHELTHVIQQRAGRVAGADSGDGLRVSDPGDRFERAAEANAVRVMRAPFPVQRSVTSGRVGTTGHDAAQGSGKGPGGPGDLVVQRALDYIAKPQPDKVRHWASPGSGRVVRSQMLTDGTLAGGPPSADPPGYGYIRALGLTKSWIRFHLVNNRAGGPGTANNLVPGSVSDNAQYHHDFEQALKDDVEAVEEEPGYYVWFGVEVTYGHTAATGASALEAANAGNFPTRLNVYHKYYDGAKKKWKWRQNGTVFNFARTQPHDTTVPANLNAVTLAQLQQYTGYGPTTRAWTAGDATFLRSVATGGSRHADLTTLLGGGTSADDYYNALDMINFGTSGTTFGERIGTDHDDDEGGGPLPTLAACLATGRFIL
jgi:hypothetical protein